MPSIAAMSYRHGLGFPYVCPDNDLSYSENFMNMLWKMVEPKYVANPVLAHALDILFILHADHEQNCSAKATKARSLWPVSIPQLDDRVGTFWCGGSRTQPCLRKLAALGLGPTSLGQDGPQRDNSCGTQRARLFGQPEGRTRL